MADLTKTLKDALYVGVGFGVLTFQRAQVQRQELQKQLGQQLDEARDTVQKLSGTAEDRFKVLEQRLTELEDRVESVLDQVEDKLPEQARELVKQARDAAKDAQGQLRALVTRTNGSTKAA